MKLRADFVTNSSSSSFIITNKTHPGAIALLASGRIMNLDNDIEDDWDNEIWGWCDKNGFEWDEFLEQISFSG